MSVTLSSLPGKFKCSLFFCLGGITPNYSLTGPNNTIYIYIYIYIYVYIYILSSTDRSVLFYQNFFSVARQARFPKLGLNTD